VIYKKTSGGGANFAAIGSSLGFTSDNTFDIGDATNSVRYIFLYSGVKRESGAVVFDTLNGRVNDSSGNASIYTDSQLLRTGDHGAPVTKLDWSGTTDIAIGNSAGKITANTNIVPVSDGSKSLGDVSTAFNYVYCRRLNSTNGEIGVYVDFKPNTNASIVFGDATHRWLGMFGTYVNIASASAPLAVEGNMYYDTVSHTLQIYNGTAWKTVTMI
jgi:hypothetical protein